MWFFIFLYQKCKDTTGKIFFLKTSIFLNQTLQSGLPNISGYINFTGICEEKNGCFTSAQINTMRKAGTASIDITKIIFDASASNNIYGNSTIVQPPALCVNVFICVK